MNSNFGGGININNHTQILRILVFVLIIAAIVVIVMLEYKKHKKSTNSCDSISKQYGSKDSIVINSNSGVKGLALKDVAIMGAYNACATDNLCHSYVNLCALRAWLKTGIRALDFEIYSKNNEPVIAVSGDDSYCLKQSYNNLDLNQVMQTVSESAFEKSPNGPNNSSDPLFINLRIKSSNSSLYDNVFKAINSNLGKYLATNQAAKTSIFTKYNSDDMPILNTKIQDLSNKVIIIFDMTTMVNNNNNLAKLSPDLASIVNIYIPLARLDKLHKLSKANHVGFKVLIPNLSCSSINSTTSSQNTSSLDKQINICFMSFQSQDTSLTSYLKKFSDKSDSYYSMIKLTDWSNDTNNPLNSNPLDNPSCNFVEHTKDQFGLPKQTTQSLQNTLNSNNVKADEQKAESTATSGYNYMKNKMNSKEATDDEQEAKTDATSGYNYMKGKLGSL